MTCKFCEREVEHVGAGLCNRCYSWVNYWRKQPVTKFMKRLETLDFWSERGHKASKVFGGNKVVRMPKKKARRRA